MSQARWAPARQHRFSPCRWLVWSLTSARRAGRDRPASDLDAAPLAAVSWPPSTGLLVSEVVTGGASASDEFVEIYNAVGAAIDLGGLELVYVTSTGRP